MEDLGYEYLHCDLLDRTVLTIIILRVKSPHMKCMNSNCKEASL
jgi:hypothetical protein